MQISVTPEFIKDELVDFVSQSRLPTKGEAYNVQLSFFILHSAFLIRAPRSQNFFKNFSLSFTNPPSAPFILMET